MLWALKPITFSKQSGFKIQKNKKFSFPRVFFLSAVPEKEAPLRFFSFLRSSVFCRRSRRKEIVEGGNQKTRRRVLGFLLDRRSPLRPFWRSDLCSVLPRSCKALAPISPGSPIDVQIHRRKSWSVQICRRLPVFPVFVPENHRSLFFCIDQGKEKISLVARSRPRSISVSCSREEEIHAWI